MAAHFEEFILHAVARKDVVGAAVIAVDKDGRTLLANSYGKLDITSDAPPFSLDTVLWVASCTKLMTAISALQCVERGVLDLDASVATILPELFEPDILIGFNEYSGEPVLKKAITPITLRHLLSHSSGLASVEMSPLLQKYQEYIGRPSHSGKKFVEEHYLYPLLFEPGESFAYGPGVDWVGKMIERANGGIGLGEILNRDIWTPLEMKDTTFRPLQRPKFVERMPARVIRGSDGVLKPYRGNLYQILDPGDDLGGSGIYTTAKDFIKVLRSILLDDGTLLREGRSRDLFTGQLNHPDALQKLVGHSVTGPFLAPGLPRDRSNIWDHTLAGALVSEALDGQTGKNTIYWQGLPNSFWYIDRESGVCGFYGSWLLPPADSLTAELFARFQKSMYRIMRNNSSEGEELNGHSLKDSELVPN